MGRGGEIQVGPKEQNEPSARRAGPPAGAALPRLGRSTVQLLALLGRVRPDERADVLAAFLTLLAFMAGHALLETARDALFLASLPARRLPWVYLAIAAIALAIGHREPSVVRRLSARGELGRWLLAAGTVTAGFWLVMGQERTWLLYTLYVWSGVIASLVVVRFWTVLSARFTVTQAKRVFPVIASGSVAGAILGSGFARVVTELMDPRHLVLAAAVAFVAASTAPALFDVETARTRRREWSDLGEVARAIWSRPYLTRVAVLVLLATVTFTLVDFVFKSVADRLVSPDELGAFFATTYLTINVVSLLVQVALVGWLLRHFGLVSAVAFVPAVLLLSTLGFAVVGGLALAFTMKLTDGALRHSLYRTGTELLFVPLSDGLRAQVKGVIDVLGQRGGQALASITILMLLSTPAGELTFAFLACLTAVGWLVVASGIKQHYLDLFRETLHPESKRVGRAFPALDLASLETLLVTLNAADDRRVIAALDVLEEQGKARLVPAPLLYHPSASVVVRCIELFIRARREDALAVVPRLLAHSDPEVRAGGLRAMSVLAPSRSAFQSAVDDPDARVRATALVSLVACGWDESGSARTSLASGASTQGPEVKAATALALAVRPTPELEPLLSQLVSDPDVDVARAAIQAAGELQTAGLLDALVHCLGRRAVREEARAAIARYGALALTHLAEALATDTVPHSVRTQIPAAIASLGSNQAPVVLLHHLETERDGLIRFKVLRALGRWRKEQPGFPLDTSVLLDALSQAVTTAQGLMRWRHVLEEAAADDPALRTELHEILVALLRDKQDHALERAFRLLNLQAGSDEFQRIYRGLHSPLAASRAGSRELLAHMVVPPVREPLITLVDDLHGERFSDRETARSARRAREAYARVLCDVVACGMESASALAAAVAAEHGMVRVAETLGSVPGLSPEHARALTRARQALLEATS